MDTEKLIDNMDNRYLVFEQRGKHFCLRSNCQMIMFNRRQMIELIDKLTEVL